MSVDFSVPPDGPLAAVPERNSGDHLLRLLQQHHVQLSAMADTKANIIITVASIVLTLALGRLNDPELRPGLLVLSLFSLLALLLAVLAVLPKYRQSRSRHAQPGSLNIMFFGDFTYYNEDEYLNAMCAAMMPGRAYETVVRDVYALGSFLAQRKYPYLRWSYIFFLCGFFAACTVQIIWLLGLGWQ